MSRLLFGTAVLGHGLLHLLGLRATATKGTGSVGGVLAAGLLGLGGMGILRRKSWGIPVAGAGLLVFQGAMVQHRRAVGAGTLANAGLGLVLGAAWAGAWAHHRLRTQARQLAAQAAPRAAGAEQLNGLPPAARRYLAYAGVLNRPPVAAVALRQTGQLRTAPGQPWLSFSAEQYFTLRPASFLWLASLPCAGLPLLQVQDGYVAGRGSTQVRAAALWPLVSSQGPEMDQGALQRYLAEAVWFPLAYLQDNVRLEAVDDTTFTATLTTALHPATVTLHTDEAGRLVAVTARRYRQAGGAFVLSDWSVQVLAYGALAGVRMPTAFRVVWRLPEGDVESIRLTVTDVRYQVAAADPERPVKGGAAR